MRIKRPIDDGEAARVLTYLAVIQIRAMARRREPFFEWMGDDYVACIGWLADLVHSLAGAPPPTMRLPFPRRRHRVMEHTWAVADDAGRRWILEALEREGRAWNPPTGGKPALGGLIARWARCREGG
ncbi:hypothetical protein GA0115240_123610 [Streptomyces sp. DvalAA-14]|uniref:hypothetical protein n=1 Tax=unclassified Streptomyces TaxID=2593676 RepID=UPI00081B88B9|nr:MULTISPECIES: hypothetical protein [unclassified Streptomyces]MYS20805.1 hypothetical protein [Streptomyces sp. SID4948]SCD77648.1 hypothetical protein GA0115240_123610 [Streptomyces sp. DvalAA-14]